MISLLHVDSDGAIRAALKEYLTSRGDISVVSLPSAYEALDLIRIHPVDIIVSEYYLPVTDGQTFLEILRLGRKDCTPFIFFARKTENRAIINALNTGATYYVLKGRDPADEFAVLEHFIRQAIQHKALEDAFREKERQYRNIVEDQSEFIARFDPEGRMVFINKAFCLYFGMSRDGILGEKIQDLFPAEYWGELFSHLESLGSKNPVHSHDTRFVGDDGSVLWQHWVGRALFNEDGGLLEYQVVGRDITARKNAESALVQANRNLGVMNTITRHDILNQLTGVFNYLDLARASVQDPQVQGFLGRVFRAAETIKGQILFTTDYQKIGCSTAQWQNLDLLVTKASSGLDLSHIRIENHLTNLWIYADPLVEKVFYNLMDNTLRHAGNATCVRLSTEERDDHLVIIYEDDGMGIPLDVKEKIFRREYYQNSGWGLYLIREILAITGIRIQECGTPGTGARFEIQIPAGKYGRQFNASMEKSELPLEL